MLAEDYEVVKERAAKRSAPHSEIIRDIVLSGIGADRDADPPARDAPPLISTSIRLSAREIAWVDRWAEEKGLNRAGAMRMILTEWARNRRRLVGRK